MENLPEDAVYSLFEYLEDKDMGNCLIASRHLYTAYIDSSKLSFSSHFVGLWEWLCFWKYNLTGVGKAEAKEVFFSLAVERTQGQHDGSTFFVPPAAQWAVSFWIFPTIHWFCEGWKEDYVVPGSMQRTLFPVRQIASFSDGINLLNSC